MKIKTAIQIIFALILIGCKKQEVQIPIEQTQSTESAAKRIEIRASENHVWVDGRHVFTPALFYWNVGEVHEVIANSSWGGSLSSVSIEIYKDMVLDAEVRGRTSVKIDYEVQP